jgi:DUF1680 family protein
MSFKINEHRSRGNPSIVERELYNGALSGLSLSGDKFFYVDPLASKGNQTSG